MIPNYSKYKEQVNSPQRIVDFVKSSTTTQAGRPYSLWASTPNAGAVPTTAAACDNTLAGALTSNTAITANKILRFLNIDIASSFSLFILCDRLSHQGGLLCNTVKGQQTNLPTAALTRYTDGVGVYAGLEFSGVSGGTPSTYILRYTNDKGTANRMSYPTQVGGSQYGTTAQRFIITPLFQGDRGIRSVEEFQLTINTGDTGACGLVLFKPLLYVPMYVQNYTESIDAVLGAGARFVQIQNTACLFWLAVTYSTLTGTVVGSVSFGED
jgi:hypothetical protein